MIEAELHDGRVLEFPDGTAPEVVQATVKKMLGPKTVPVTASGVGAEIGKGLVRGASDLALAAPKAVGSMLLGPIGGEAVTRGVEALAAPSRELVQARPQNPTEQFAGTAAGIVGAGAAGGGMGSVRGAVTNLLSGLGGATGERVAGPVGTVIGSIAPGVAGAGLSAVKNAIASRAAPIVETFKQAGTTPSVGQATDNVFLHGLENLAAKFPGGAGVMQDFIKKQQSGIGAIARTGVPTEAAGRAIEKGITGEGGFIKNTRQIWQQLDNELGAKVGKDFRFAPTNTLNALDELIKPPVAGAEQTTAALVNPKIAEIAQKFKADATNNLGGMPFEALRALRSRVGSMLDDALVTGIPGGEMKKLYGALSKDLEEGAKAIGAGKEFARQNNYYRSRMERIESVLDRVIGKGKQPEDIFKSFYPTDPDQANKVRAVMRSLAPSERQVVSEAVVNRMGRASPGKQNDVGEVFSTETFLTNWNKLSDGAKAQLFPDPPMRENIQKIAKAASEIRTGRGIYANPSGTAGSFAAYSVYLSPLAAIASASVSPVVAAGSAAGAAYVGAKMMTSPKVVEWLARPVNPRTPGEAAAHLARLASIYNNSKDPELRKELSDYMGSLNQQK